VKKHRQERVSDLIAREISIILHNESPDNRFMLTTITGAKISRDLKIAYVYVSMINPEAEREVLLKELIENSRLYRTEIGHRLRLKYTPEIHFIYDDSVERGVRLVEEIEALNREAADEGGDDSE